MQFVQYFTYKYVVCCCLMQNFQSPTLSTARKTTHLPTKQNQPSIHSFIHSFSIIFIPDIEIISCTKPPSPFKMKLKLLMFCCLGYKFKNKRKLFVFHCDFRYTLWVFLCVSLHKYIHNIYIK